MSEIKGSCRCGKVTYEATTEPIFTGVCHCRNCQKQCGSAFATDVAIRAPSLTVSGVTTRFASTCGAGISTQRDFCPVCGSTIKIQYDAMAGIVMLPAGSLDDSSFIYPAMQIFCDNAQPWVSLGGEMQRFAGVPV
jgi:hypothetical protein